MRLEVFIFGAEDGAVAYPNTDARYFESMFYQTPDIKRVPILDVRLRLIDGRCFTDYTLLLYGLTATIGRPDAHIGITYRLEGYVDKCTHIYHFLMNEFSGKVDGVVVNRDRFIKPISDFKELPQVLEQRFASCFSDQDITPIISSQKADSRIISYNPKDIDNAEIKRRVFARETIRISNSYPSRELLAMQERQTKMKTKYAKEIKETEARVKTQAQEQINSLQTQIDRLTEEKKRIITSKESSEATIQEIRKLLQLPSPPATQLHDEKLFKPQDIAYNAKGLSRLTYLLSRPALQGGLLLISCVVSLLTLLFVSGIIVSSSSSHTKSASPTPTEHVQDSTKRASISTPQ